MIDPDLKTQLDEINKNLINIQKKSSRGIWRSFFNGMFSALGYVVGLAIVVVILGWVLQKTGLLPEFKQQVRNFSDLIDQARKLTSPSSPSDSQNNVGGGETTVTLPDGRQVKVRVPAQ